MFTAAPGERNDVTVESAPGDGGPNRLEGRAGRDRVVGRGGRDRITVGGARVASGHTVRVTRPATVVFEALGACDERRHDWTVEDKEVSDPVRFRLL